jgi:hypothetical protein
MDRIIDSPYNRHKFPNEVFRIATFIDKEAMYHEREIFNLVDLIGELGGVIEILIITFGVLLYPISR